MDVVLVVRLTVVVSDNRVKFVVTYKVTYCFYIYVFICIKPKGFENKQDFICCFPKVNICHCKSAIIAQKLSFIWLWLVSIYMPILFINIFQIGIHRILMFCIIRVDLDFEKLRKIFFILRKMVFLFCSF